jgi:dethiobiotin synthetase
METEDVIDARPVRVAVVGTGTGVGKTHFSVALLHALSLQGRSAVGLKPVESGLGSEESDAARLAAASTFHVKHPAPYGFPDAVSPHLAARRAGIEINASRVLDWVAGCSAPWTIIETAGGLLSPLARSLTNLDLVELLAPDLIILVGVDRLGILHDVAACLLALATTSAVLPPAAVVLQAPDVADTSTGTNAEELVTLEMVQHATVVPRGAPSSRPVAEVMMELLVRLQLQVPGRGFT